MSLREYLRWLFAPPPSTQASPGTTPLETPDILTVFGAGWCADCGRAKRYLDAKGVSYRYVDLMRDGAAQQRLADAGYRAIPVVVASDGRVLIEPSNAELEGLLRPQSAHLS